MQRHIGVVIGDGCVIDRVDCDGHGRRRRVPIGIGDRISKRVGAVEVWHRGVGVVPGGVHNNGSTVGTGGVICSHRGRLITKIVVDHHTTRNWSVFQRRVRIFDRIRVGINRDRDGGRRGVAVVISDLVGEGVDAVEVGRRRVRVVPSRVHDDRSTIHAGAVIRRDRGRLNPKIIIAQNRTRHRRVLLGRIRVIDRIRRRSIRHPDRGRRRLTVHVGDRVVKRIRTEEVSRRCIRIVPGGIHRHNPTRNRDSVIRRDRRRLGSQIIITENATGYRNILERRVGVVDCVRCGRDRDRHGGRRGVTINIGDRVRERVRPVEIGRRGVGVITGGIHSDSSAIGASHVIGCDRRRLRTQIIIREHGAGYGQVLKCRGGVVDRVRVGINRDRDRRCVTVAVSIAHLVVERCRAEEVRRRRIGERPIAVECQASGGKADHRIGSRRIPGVSIRDGSQQHCILFHQESVIDRVGIRIHDDRDGCRVT